MLCKTLHACITSDQWWLKSIKTVEEQSKHGELINALIRRWKATFSRGNKTHPACFGAVARNPWGCPPAPCRRRRRRRQTLVWASSRAAQFTNTPWGCPKKEKYREKEKKSGAQKGWAAPSQRPGKTVRCSAWVLLAARAPRRLRHPHSLFPESGPQGASARTVIVTAGARIRNTRPLDARSLANWLARDLCPLCESRHANAREGAAKWGKSNNSGTMNGVSQRALATVAHQKRR